jgi:hypothetical protein
MFRMNAPEHYDLERVGIVLPLNKASPMTANLIKFEDIVTGKMITTIRAMILHITMGNMLWAEVEMHCDPDGNPLLDGPPFVNPLDGLTVLWGNFTAQVDWIK